MTTGDAGRSQPAGRNIAVVRRGRGAVANPDPRFARLRRERCDDGWRDDDPALEPLATTVTVERARRIIATNDAPDVPFEQSINPYRGCEHGCVYCYARPSHGYLDLSPGLDFETRLFAKPDAAALLRRELAVPGYRCRPIALGANTDPYQPIEREWRITRELIGVLAEHRHPFTVTTKSALVERDLDLIAPLAALGLVAIHVSVTTLDGDLARRLEPRAAAPARRLETIRRVAAAGIPVGVLFAPVIPALNDHELEDVLERAAAAGARNAAYVLLRLPHELPRLFSDWLAVHVPLRAERVLARLRDMRGGRDNDPRFGSRMRGGGAFAQLLAQRYRRACKRFGLERSGHDLSTVQFVPPPRDRQLPLF
ncbi:MAG: PA0069 family radical SAM protein [Gammaproteobacteria bacterium]|nr:PA0069 family radical SAM protein [Gammaproteobacteria bacterium]